MIFNFKKGQTAIFLEDLIEREISNQSVYSFNPVKNISYNKIKIINGNYLYNNGEDLFFMFAYLKQYNTIKYNNLPKYHVCQCDTRKEFSGFVFSSKMPVDIYCRDIRKTLEGKHLKLCKNCNREQSKNIWSSIFRSKNWYDSVIDYAESRNSQFTVQKNGYINLWRQLSEAIREKNGFKCSNCKIDLNQDKKYLDVHHIDRNKQNNLYENLLPLCVLCHASIDGLGKSGLHEMNFKKFKDSSIRLKYFLKIHKKRIPHKSKFYNSFWRKYFEL
jgi:5-methylcytosine-specific restriction endonuclease McrA